MASTFKTRLGRCYELAYQHAMQTSGVLVHGTIQRDPHPPIDHAWVKLPSGELYEPITQMTMDEAAFTRYFGTVTHHEYPIEQYLALALKTSVYGPWRDDERDSTRPD